MQYRQTSCRQLKKVASQNRAGIRQMVSPRLLTRDVLCCAMLDELSTYSKEDVSHLTARPGTACLGPS